MKKYYIILGTIVVAFIFSIVALILNPMSTTFLSHDARFLEPEPSSPAGDAILDITLILVALAIIAILAYRIYKLCRKIVFKIRKKKDVKDFNSDASELYTKSQSSENISKWLISTTRGRLDKKDEKKL